MTETVVWHQFPERTDMSWARIGGPGPVGPRVTVQVFKMFFGWSVRVSSHPCAGTPFLLKISGSCTESGARNRGLRIARRYQRRVREQRARADR